jgi:hypothetical protein
MIWSDYIARKRVFGDNGLAEMNLEDLCGSGLPIATGLHALLKGFGACNALPDLESL